MGVFGVGSIANAALIVDADPAFILKSFLFHTSCSCYPFSPLRGSPEVNKFKLYLPLGTGDETPDMNFLVVIIP